MTQLYDNKKKSTAYSQYIQIYIHKITYTYKHIHKHTDTPTKLYTDYLNNITKKSYISKIKQKKKKKLKQLTTTYVLKLVTLAVAFHMCYRVPILILKQVIVIEVIICKMQKKGTSPKGIPIFKKYTNLKNNIINKIKINRKT